MRQTCAIGSATPDCWMLKIHANIAAIPQEIGLTVQTIFKYTRAGSDLAKLRESRDYLYVYLDNITYRLTPMHTSKSDQVSL